MGKKLYFGPERPTEKKSGRYAGSEVDSEVHSNNRPEAPQRNPSSYASHSSYQSSKRPHKPRPSAAQQPPPHPHPQPEPHYPHSTNRDDSFRQNFVKIQGILSRFASARIVCPSPLIHLESWPQAQQGFKRFDEMLREKMGCLQLSSQFGTLTYLLKRSWAQCCNADASSFVQGFSFGAMISMMQIREQDLLTRKLWEAAEKSFVEHEKGFEHAQMEIIKSTISNIDDRLREMFYRVLPTLHDFRMRDNARFAQQMTSSEGMSLMHKVAVQLRRACMSNESGVSCEWLAVDVARILITLRLLRAERLLCTESGRIRRWNIFPGFDHWMSETGLAKIVDAEVKEWIRAAFYRNRDVAVHPFRDLFVPPRWVLIARAKQSQLGGREQRWWRW